MRRLLRPRAGRVPALRRALTAVTALATASLLGTTLFGAMWSGSHAQANTSGSAVSPTVQSYRVDATFPHSVECFVEGLVWVGSGFLESCGLYGQSTVRVVSLRGVTSRSRAIDGRYFGEGLTKLGSRVFHLTWRERVVLVRDAASLKQLGDRPLPTAVAEGWGLTTDGKRLIASDGSATLYWLDPVSLAVVRSVRVQEGGVEIRNLNELEFIAGEVWANVWQTDRIVRIDPATGAVRGVVDLTGLRPTSTLSDPDAVLNGIAYDAKGKRIFVTGKRWPSVFQITVVP